MYLADKKTHGDMFLDGFVLAPENRSRTNAFPAHPARMSMVLAHPARMSAVLAQMGHLGIHSSHVSRPHALLPLRPAGSAMLRMLQGYAQLIRVGSEGSERQLRGKEWYR